MSLLRLLLIVVGGLLSVRPPVESRTDAVPDGGIVLDQKVGIEYYKLVFGQAELADRFMFEVTKYNLIAFAAITGFGTSGVLGSFQRPTLVMILCGVITAISFGASVLVFYYKRYSEYLYERAWIIEKAWLRGRTGHGVVRRLQEHNQSWRRLKKRQGKLFYLSQFARYFPFVNLMPGFLALVVLIFVAIGSIRVA